MTDDLSARLRDVLSDEVFKAAGDCSSQAYLTEKSRGSTAEVAERAHKDAYRESLIESVLPLFLSLQEEQRREIREPEAGMSGEQIADWLDDHTALLSTPKCDRPVLREASRRLRGMDRRFSATDCGDENCSTEEYGIGRCEKHAQVTTTQGKP